MPRIANYQLQDKESAIGRGISNLGIALFGDPAAQEQRELRRSQIETAALQRDKIRFELERQRAKDARNAALRASLLPGAAAAAGIQIPAANGAGAPPPVPGPEGGVSPGLADGYMPRMPQEQIAEPSPRPAPIDVVELAAPNSFSIGPLDDTGFRLPQGYAQTLMADESGGRPDARSPTSSAAGLYGFTAPTWAQYAPPGSHAAAATQEQADETLRRFTGANARALQAAGIPVTPANLRAAHHFGATGAQRVISAPGDQPIDIALSEEALAANPQLKGKLAGDVLGGFSKYNVAAGYLPESLPQTIDMAGVRSSSDVLAGTGPGGAETSSMTFAAAPEPRVPQSPAVAPETGTGQATKPANPSPREIVAALTPAQKFAIQNSDDPEETLQKILLSKQAPQFGEAGEKGPFAGTGFDASAYNVVYAYQRMMQAGGTPTPDMTLAYNLALSHLQAPKMQMTPEGPVVVTRNIPGITAPGGAAPAPEAPAAATGAPPAAPTATAAPSAPAAATGAPAAPGGTPRAAGGLTMTPAGGPQQKPLPADIAGKAAAAREGMTDIQTARSIYLPKDKAGKESPARFDIATGQWIGIPGTPIGVAGVPWTEGRDARQAMMRGTQGIWRILTGAAMPESEQAAFEEMFVPSPADSDVAIMNKMNAAEAWAARMSAYIEAGRGGAMKPEEIMQEAAAAARQSVQPGAPRPRAPGAPEPAAAPAAPAAPKGLAPGATVSGDQVGTLPEGTIVRGSDGKRYRITGGRPTPME